MGKGSQRDAEDFGLHSRSHHSSGTQRERYQSAPSSLPLKCFSSTLFPPSSSSLLHNTKGICAKNKKDDDPYVCFAD